MDEGWWHPGRSHSFVKCDPKRWAKAKARSTIKRSSLNNGTSLASSGLGPPFPVCGGEGRGEARQGGVEQDQQQGGGHLEDSWGISGDPGEGGGQFVECERRGSDLPTVRSAFVLDESVIDLLHKK